MWDKVKQAFRHNQFMAMAVLVCVVGVLWVYGCTSTTKSPWNPAEKLSRVELTAEIEMVNAKIKAAYADLDRQDLFKQQLFEAVEVVAEGGTVNPAGVVVGLLGVLGIGAVADNRKKDSVIKTLQNGGTNGPESSTTTS